MVYITGDTHGDIDFKKFNIPVLKSLTKEDYVIIAGDCGVLFVDGNHENFTLLNSYPIEEWHGGKVHKLNEGLIHLKRGQVLIED